MILPILFALFVVYTLIRLSDLRDDVEAMGEQIDLLWERDK